MASLMRGLPRKCQGGKEEGFVLGKTMLFSSASHGLPKNKCDFRPTFGCLGEDVRGFLRQVWHLRPVGAMLLVSLAASASPERAAATPISARGLAQHWPMRVDAPPGAPNIVLILLDDVGFGDASAFGGAIETPALSRLAARGLAYNRFHTTGLCSPTRAALLTGRNHHRVGQGTVGEAGFRGYDGVWPKTAVSIAEILRRNGYSTAAFGKWHNTPFSDLSPLGPFDQWPTQLGFETYYGNMLGASSQWTPKLWRNTTRVKPGKTGDPGYHYTSDIVDEALSWLNLRNRYRSTRPYFLYLATGATHTPHQVPKAWIEQYRGRFDQGWSQLRIDILNRQKAMGIVPANTRLSRMPSGLPDWDKLPLREKRVYARQMEAYAGFLSQTDHEIGRLLSAIEASPERDNTLIVYIVGDNGAAGGYLHGSRPPELSGTAFENWLEAYGSTAAGTAYGAGWAIAGSTPFPQAKGIASHLGATRNPMVICWPRAIASQGQLRTQFTHVTDLVPTFLEATGIKPAAKIDGVRQMSLDGASLVYSFNHPAAPSRHRTQYFEIWGNRAIYQDGWIASARHWAAPWMPSDLYDASESYRADRWELYHLDADFSQSVDLAARHPARLLRMRRLFEAEARRNHVYPLISGDLYGTTRPDPTLQFDWRGD